MYKLTLTTLLFIGFSCASLLSFAQNLQLKKSVAITDFRDITGGAGGDPNAQQPAQQQDPNQAQAQGGQPQGQPGQDPNAQPAAHGDYNSILTTMLTTELVKTNSFIVSEGAQPGDASQFMITGTITKWETTPKGAPGSITSYHSKLISTISIDLRIIDASTGTILAAQTATSTVTQKNIFNNKVDHTLDSAERKVILQCVDYIKTASIKVPWQGSIVKVNTDGSVFIKPGSGGGVTTGMIFDVYRLGEEVKDDSGNSLGHDEKKIGSVTVTGDIGGGKAAKASLTSGKGIKAGDILKPAQ
jgi:hypothetical protein